MGYIEDLAQVISSYEALAILINLIGIDHECKILFSYDLLKAISSLSKYVYINENLHCCNGCHHDLTCSS